MLQILKKMKTYVPSCSTRIYLTFHPCEWRFACFVFCKLMSMIWKLWQGTDLLWHVLGDFLVHGVQKRRTWSRWDLCKGCGLREAEEKGVEGNGYVGQEHRAEGGVTKSLSYWASNLIILLMISMILMAPACLNWEFYSVALCSKTMTGWSRVGKVRNMLTSLKWYSAGEKLEAAAA